MTSSKAQSATEFMILITFILLVFLPIFFILISYGSSSTQQISSVQINEISQRIVSEAREMYYLGQWSKEEVTINFPDGIESVQTLYVEDDKGTIGGPGDEADDIMEYALIINYVKGGIVQSVVVHSEVPIFYGSCVPALNLPCDSGIIPSSTARCEVCEFPDTAISAGQKKFRLETKRFSNSPSITDWLHNKLYVEITQV